MTALWRVRDRATFAALSRSRRVRSGPVTVSFVPGPSGQPPRVAFAVGRRAGGAVTRNRVRRRLRAVFAELAPGLVPGAYLVSAGTEAATIPYDELRTIVAAATRQAAHPQGPGERAR